MRHDIKIFGKNIFFSSQNFGFKRKKQKQKQHNSTTKVDTRSLKKAIFRELGTMWYRHLGTDMPYTVGKPEFQRFLWYNNLFFKSHFCLKKIRKTKVRKFFNNLTLKWL
jgi:predicted 2-oxoglutarate/Fe(II)-dependent dioxygenase YbiX